MYMRRFSFDKSIFLPHGGAQRHIKANPSWRHIPILFTDMFLYITEVPKKMSVPCEMGEEHDKA